MRDSKKFASIGTFTERKEMNDASVEAIIINTSMVESISSEREGAPRNG